MKYTKKQISEAIAYWQKVLESFNAGENGHITTVGQLKQQLSGFSDDTLLLFTEGDGVPVYEIANIWTSDEFKDNKTYPEDQIVENACYIRVAHKSDDK